jgi:hypothetical protein
MNLHSENGMGYRNDILKEKKLMLLFQALLRFSVYCQQKSVTQRTLQVAYLNFISVFLHNKWVPHEL